MYIDAEVHKTKVKLLVDTGATVTIKSERIYDKIPELARPRLGKVHQDILTASGERLQVLGKGSFAIGLNEPKDVFVEAVVAKINTDGILGLDMMKERKGSLDFEKGVLTLDGVKVPTTYEMRVQWDVTDSVPWRML